MFLKCLDYLQSKQEAGLRFIGFLSLSVVINLFNAHGVYTYQMAPGHCDKPNCDSHVGINPFQCTLQLALNYSTISLLSLQQATKISYADTNLISSKSSMFVMLLKDRHAMYGMNQYPRVQQMLYSVVECKWQLYSPCKYGCQMLNDLYYNLQLKKH